MTLEQLNIIDACIKLFKMEEREHLSPEAIADMLACLSHSVDPDNVQRVQLRLLRIIATQPLGHIA